MYSRAHLLIERDFERFVKDKPWGIEATTLEDENMFEWTAKINGLKHTIWEGGVFRLYLKFNEHYNLQPPVVCFHTIPFHPNIDMITGRPCVNFLDDFNEWSTDYSLGFILTSMQTLLSNPVIDEKAVNQEAVDMMLNNPQGYKQMVLDCVAASQRVEVGLHPQSADDEKVRFGPVSESPVQFYKQPSNVQQPQRTSKISKLSFEDYHSTWAGIATSKARSDHKNPYLESIKDKPNVQQVHATIPFEEIQNQMQKQMDDHATLIYGNLDTRSKDKEKEKQNKIAKLNQMRKIYLPSRTKTLSPTQAPEPTPRGRTDEPWEREVDDLVAWTNNLNPDQLLM